MERKEVVNRIEPCPYVKKPVSDECYITKTDFMSVLRIMEYCAKNFTQCYLYDSLSSKYGLWTGNKLHSF